MYGININTESNISITRQICNQIRLLIESGKLKSGMKLPPTRKMADELHINRNTIVVVYEQLTAEGYLESHIGSGTFVSSEINWNTDRSETNDITIPLKANLKTLKTDVIRFETGFPDLSLLPLDTWGKLFRQASENAYYIKDSLSNIMGDIELRKSISDYIFRIKGIHCQPEQVMVVSGSSEGFLLIAQTLSEEFNTIYMEDPTVEFTCNIFSQMHYKINPIPVDESGMYIPDIKNSTERGLILLTPSHQFPTGSILPIKRRLQAIDISVKTDGYIIEDDYDSEFRFKGIPIPPLQVLSPSRVIYVGTFSKTIFPGLRLGFIIIPRQLVGKMKMVKDKLNMFTSLIEQRTLASFISEGHLDHHIYKMKKVYKKRRDLLVECLNKYFGDEINILGDDSGMHLLVEFKESLCSKINWNTSIKFGVMVDPVEDYCMVKGKCRNRIVLGYGNINPSSIEEGIKRLYQFIHSTK